MEQCNAFATRLSERRLSLWRRKGWDGVAAAEALQAVIGDPEDSEESAESDDDGDDAARQQLAQQRAQDSAAVQAAAWGLLSLDNYVSQSAVSAPLRARLGHWRGELRRAIPPADAKVVCKLFLEFLDGLVKERLSGDELASVDAALEKLRGGHTRASSALAAADLQAAVDACRVAIGARARSRRKASAKQRAPWLLKKRRELHQRTERQNVQVVRGRDRIMKFKHDCITLPTAPVLALEELQKLRARGDAAISSTTPQEPVAGLVLYRTDAYELPHWSTTCLLWQLFSLLGCSAGRLGVASDPVVRLNPKGMTFSDLGRMVLRNPASPMGAVVLRRVELAQWEVVRRREGVFIFSGWLRRGDTTVPHAVGFNAGAGLLHVGPYVVVVQESDRIHLDVFAARMDAQYGLHLSEKCKSRQVLLNPRHAAARQLAYNTPDDLDELQGRRLSASAKKRAAKKRKRSASPEALCLEK